jgi:hypothetical protein
MLWYRQGKTDMFGKKTCPIATLSIRNLTELIETGPLRRDKPPALWHGSRICHEFKCSGMQWNTDERRQQTILKISYVTRNFAICTDHVVRLLLRSERKLRWAGHVVRIRSKKHTGLWWGKYLGRWPTGRWVDYIKTDIRKSPSAQKSPTSNSCYIQKLSYYSFSKTGRRETPHPAFCFRQMLDKSWKHSAQYISCLWTLWKGVVQSGGKYYRPQQSHWILHTNVTSYQLKHV